jgi:hypothetical protein
MNFEIFASKIGGQFASARGGQFNRHLQFHIITLDSGWE